MNPIADRFHNAPIAKTIGFDVSCNPANEVEVSLSVSSHLWNPMGKLQGGVMSILADAAMGIAFGRELSPDCEFSTIVGGSLTVFSIYILGKVPSTGSSIRLVTDSGTCQTISTCFSYRESYRKTVNFPTSNS